MESKLQDYEEQETGWAVSALEVSHSAIAVMLHLRSLSGGGSANSVGPVKFYKGGSQEKTLLLRPEFFLLPSPRERARVLTSRTPVSVCWTQ